MNLGVDEIIDFNFDLDLILFDLKIFIEIIIVFGENIGDEFVIVESKGDVVISDVIIVYNFNNGILFYNVNGIINGFGDGG